MKRLTMTNAEMDEIRKLSPTFNCPVKAEKDSNVQRFCDSVCDEWEFDCPFMKMGQRLKMYEDAEEQCIKECGCDLNMVALKYQEFLEHMHELAEYWEAEKRGLLLRLPCKVGDTLYCVGTECLADIVPDEECDLLIGCDECRHNKKWVVFERTATKYLIGVLMGYGMLSNFEYNKNVFLTREEAEAALEKMNGGTE